MEHTLLYSQKKIIKQFLLEKITTKLPTSKVVACVLVTLFQGRLGLLYQNQEKLTGRQFL